MTQTNFMNTKDGLLTVSQLYYLDEQQSDYCQNFITEQKIAFAFAFFMFIFLVKLCSQASIQSTFFTNSPQLSYNPLILSLPFFSFFPFFVPYSAISLSFSQIYSFQTVILFILIILNLLSFCSTFKSINYSSLYSSLIIYLQQFLLFKQIIHSSIMTSNWLDNLTHGWIYTLIQHGNQKDIKQETLSDLQIEEKSQSVYNQWKIHWQIALRNNTEDPLKQSLKDTFFRRYVTASIFDFLAYQLTILTSIFIFFICKLLVTDPRPQNMQFWCVFWFIFIPLCRFLRSIFDTHASYQLGALGTDISNCIALGMVSKSLKYSTLCNKMYKMGEISNLMQVDCFRLGLYPKSINGVMFLSYILIFSIAVMAFLVNFAVLAGFQVLLIASVVNMFITRSRSEYQKQIANAADNRMTLTTEVFNNIKFIKVNAWQEYFYQKLTEKREQEIKWYKKKFISEAFSTYSMWLTPKLVLGATFGIYCAMTDNLSPPIALCIMNLYGYMQFYLQYLPNYISIVGECNNSLKRIQAFLLAQQINISCISYGQSNTSSAYSIQVQNGSFYWDRQEEGQDVIAAQPSLTLTDMNFNVKKGEIVAIIGDVGSGKSSLLYSLLGEMKFKQSSPRPKVTINGSVSLVTQKPWIVNDTVKNNILFGKPFIQKKYDQIIHYACLKRDLELFTHGDQTMIGEKGATLSGGQKARIAFARSLYSDSDIILLDDLLSAVDVHVGKFLMTETLLQFARTKTRVLITHALQYLKYVNKVLIIEDGKIVQQGSYETIRESKRFKDIYSKTMKKQNLKNSSSLLLSASAEKGYKFIAEKNNIVLKNLNEDQHQKQSIKPKIHQLMMAEQSPGEIGLSLYKSFAKYNGGYLTIALLFFVKTLWMLSNSANNLCLGEWSESHYKIYVKGQKDIPSNTYYFGLYVIFGFLYGTFAFFRSLIIAYISPQMSLTIHQKMISNLLFSPLNEFFDRVPLGRIFNKLSKDLNSIDNNVPASFNNTIVFMFFLITSFTIILIISPIQIFLPTFLIYLVLCHLLRSSIARPQRQLTRLQGIAKSPAISCFVQILSGTTTIRCYDVKETFFLKNCNKIDQVKKSTIAKKAVQAWFIFRLTIISIFLNFVSIGYILFWKSKQQDFVQAAAYTGLILSGCLGLDEMIYLYYASLNTFENQLISIERCQTFMNLEPQPGYVQYLRNRQQLKIKPLQRRRSIKKNEWPNKGRIQFIGFKCRYRENLDLVIKGLTVTFQGGQKIGVVGRTGSGKSTIMLAILRILQAFEGKILVDGTDISKLSLEELRSKITIILQDPCLFAGTIRENLDPLSHYTDQDLTRALQQCALDQTMNSRKGLQTQITQNGENLSVGERQLVCIARAVLKPARIVLVDEATANIDVRTESIICKAMNEAFKNSTVVTIAHRLNTVINSDQILVLEGGILKEYDNPQKLLQNPNSFFAQLYKESLKQNKM